MRHSNPLSCRLAALSALVLLASFAPLGAEELHHVTRTDFAPGSFYQTQLLGRETHPGIFLDSYTAFSWTFDDDAISGWSYAANETGNVAEESPSGQIHLRAQFISNANGSYGLAHRTDVPIPDRCSVEYLVYIDAMEASGTSDPFVTQPTGACCRFDLLRTADGFRVDLFSDRITSFYREGTTGIDYPVNGSIDITTNTGQWYTFRFDVDFSDPGMAVQVYRDDVWIGELYGDARNASVADRIRPMAFSRGSSSGLVEMHVDRVRFGTSSDEYYGAGTYTSDVIEIMATSFGPLSWDEAGTDPLPWGSWTKYAGNPVLAGPALPENILADVGDTLQQPVLYDGRYWLCYSSGGPGQSVHLAYTTDPALQAWTDYESNPVLAPAAGEDYVFSPHLFRDGGTYYLFYDVALSSDSRQRIAYATAPAPTGPWTRGQIVLDRGAAGEWDDYRVAECFVMKEGDEYYLYFMGDKGCSGCGEQIGLATTTSAYFPLGPETGGHWTKRGVVFSPDPDPGAWDELLVSNPSIVKYGGIYYMRYSGSPDNNTWRIGAAWAVDPYGPYYRTGAVDLDLGAPGSWDDDKVMRGAVQYHDGQWYGLYAGNDGSGGWTAYRGGIATAPARTPADALVFETRTSTDASVWEEWRAATNGATVQSTPDKYFQYRAAFSAGPGGLSPALAGVHLAYDKEPVATLLTFFDVEVGADAVVINWCVSSDCAVDDFRLVAGRGGEEWTVAGLTEGNGLFTARDESPVKAGGGEVTYDLYHLEDGDIWSLVHSETVSVSSIPPATSLLAPYPNPFNPSVEIMFTVDRSRKVLLTVYDTAGRRVARLADRDFAAGPHSVAWDGSNDAGRQVSSGVYFVRMDAGKFQATKRIVLMR